MRPSLLVALLALGCGDPAPPPIESSPVQSAQPGATSPGTARPAPADRSRPPAVSKPGARSYEVRPPTDADKARFIQVEEAIRRVRKDLRMLGGEAGLCNEPVEDPTAEVQRATGIKIARATQADTTGLPDWVVAWVVEAPKREVQPALGFMRVDVVGTGDTAHTFIRALRPDKSSGGACFFYAELPVPSGD